MHSWTVEVISLSRDCRFKDFGHNKTVAKLMLFFTICSSRLSGCFPHTSCCGGGRDECGESGYSILILSPPVNHQQTSHESKLLKLFGRDQAHLRLIWGMLMYFTWGFFSGLMSFIQVGPCEALRKNHMLPGLWSFLIRKHLFNLKWLPSTVLFQPRSFIFHFHLHIFWM